MEQRLVQSPQMIQAMQILQLTTPELLDRIEAELEENPFLETPGIVDASAPEEAANSTPSDSPTDRGDPDENEESLSAEEVFGMEEPLLEAFRGEGPSGRSSSSSGEDDFDALQNVAAPETESTRSIMSELRVDDLASTKSNMQTCSCGTWMNVAFWSMAWRHFPD